MIRLIIPHKMIFFLQFGLGSSSYTHNLDEYRVRYVVVKPTSANCCLRFDFHGCAGEFKRFFFIRNFLKNKIAFTIFVSQSSTTQTISLLKSIFIVNSSKCTECYLFDSHSSFN